MHAQRKPAPILAIDQRALVDERPAVARPWLLRAALVAVIFGAIGFFVGFGVAVEIVTRRLGNMERRLTPPGRVYEHGEPVRR